MTEVEKKLLKLLAVLTDDLIYLIESGNASPADKKTAMELLKNNGITCETKTSSADVTKLLKELPSFESDHYIAI